MPKLTPDWDQTSVLRAVFDQLSDALVLYDPEFIITGVNRATERLFGMNSEEMVGRHCQEVFHCSVCEPNCGVLAGINQGQNPPTCTVRLHTDNGTERLVVMKTSQLTDGNGRVEGVVATIKDITEEAAPQKREIIADSPSMRERTYQLFLSGTRCARGEREPPVRPAAGSCGDRAALPTGRARTRTGPA
jgi:PAS domain S-box-containing protein